MPPRQPADIDAAVRLPDLPGAEEALRQAGWTRLGTLRLGGGLRGSAWGRGGRELDLLGLPRRWGEEAITAAQRNVVDGRPTLTLEHLVVAKLISGRAVDVADLSRMLGAASAEALAAVRGAVTRHLPDAHQHQGGLLDAVHLEQPVDRVVEEGPHGAGPEIGRFGGQVDVLTDVPGLEQGVAVGAFAIPPAQP